ncbi:MAG: hypothetical protein RIM84_26740 [Alphaproteobacteria bacterium]
MAKKKYPPDDPKQSERFKRSAKEVEADEGDDAFEATLRRVIPPVKPKPPDLE